jgi:hypothetical protein
MKDPGVGYVRFVMRVTCDRVRNTSAVQSNVAIVIPLKPALGSAAAQLGKPRCSALRECEPQRQIHRWKPLMRVCAVKARLPIAAAQPLTVSRGSG